jgi:Cyclophilin type peptidyl-prolyl cis-trans isomerase/CLD
MSILLSFHSSRASPICNLFFFGGVLQLYPTQMPITCGNFIDLANSGFYDGIHFHRVVRIHSLERERASWQQRRCGMRGSLRHPRGIAGRAGNFEETGFSLDSGCEDPPKVYYLLVSHRLVIPTPSFSFFLLRKHYTLPCPFRLQNRFPAS